MDAPKPHELDSAVEEQTINPVLVAGVDTDDGHDHTIDLALEARMTQPADQPFGVPEGAARDDELPPKRAPRR